MSIFSFQIIWPAGHLPSALCLYSLKGILVFAGGSCFPTTATSAPLPDIRANRGSNGFNAPLGWLGGKKRNTGMKENE